MASDETLRGRVEAAGAVFSPPESGDDAASAEAAESAEPIGTGDPAGAAYPDVGPLHFGAPEEEYAALTQTSGMVWLAGRTQIELTGQDRVALLHNLCTADVRKLEVGQGCEAFLTDARGHILGFVLPWRGETALTIETVPQQGAALLAHLDRYIIREDVELHDRSQQRGELLLAGPEAHGPLTRALACTTPPAAWRFTTVPFGDQTLDIRRVDHFGETGYLISGPLSIMGQVWDALLAEGVRPCGNLAIEAVRIESSTPAYGRDISDANLPQEVGRDSRAISFTKGCYIGQETVARIDALGHVNRRLVLLEWDATEVPRPGMELTQADAKAGHVTSAAYCPGRKKALALAYVRRGHEQPGSELDSALGRATVLPWI
jgi:folate-binding protein YgfZ